MIVEYLKELGQTLLKWIPCRKKKPVILRHINAVLIDEEREEQKIDAKDLRKYTDKLKETKSDGGTRGSTFIRVHRRLKPKLFLSQQSIINNVAFILASATFIYGFSMDNCKNGDPAYFMITTNNQTGGLYSLAVSFYFDLACEWVESALNDAAKCNITTVVTRPLLLKTVLMESCYRDSNPPEMPTPKQLFSLDNDPLPTRGNTILLSAVNGSSTAITKELQCLLNKVGEQCSGSSNYLLYAWGIAGAVSVLGVTVYHGGLYWLGRKVKQGAQHIYMLFNLFRSNSSKLAS